MGAKLSYDKSLIRFGNKRKSEARLKRVGRRQERARRTAEVIRILVDTRTSLNDAEVWVR